MNIHLFAPTLSLVRYLFFLDDSRLWGTPFLSLMIYSFSTPKAERFLITVATFLMSFGFSRTQIRWRLRRCLVFSDSVSNAHRCLGMFIVTLRIVS